MRLPIWPQRAALEGPSAYLVRLAQENLLSAPALRTLIARKAIDVPEGVAQFDGVQAALIRRWARYCPSCLSDGRTWRLGWEMHFADACPECGHWLLDTCPACNARQTWRRFELNTCQSCGQPLATGRARDAPKALCRMSRALEARARELPSRELPVLNSLTLPESVLLIKLLGSYGARQGHRVPQKILDADKLEVSWTVSTLAAEILCAWPEGFHQLLGRLQRMAEPGASGRMRGTFGGLYVAIYRGLRGPAFDFVRRAFEQFIAESWSGALGRRNRRLEMSILDRVAWMHPRAACRMFDVSPSQLNHLVAAGAVAAVSRVSTTGRAFQMVRKADVMHSRRKLTDYVTLKCAAKQLGLKRQRLSRLLPVLCPEAAKYADHGVPWNVPIDWVRGWIERLQSLPVVSKSFGPGARSFDQLLRFSGSNDGDIGRILLAVQRDELQVMAALEGERRLGAMVFSAEAIESLLGARLEVTKEVWFPVPKVAEMLGVKQGVAYHLVRMGLLTAVSSSKMGRLLSLVHRDEIARFQRQYVFGREVASDMGTSPRCAVLRLSDAGVCPISGPRVDGGRQFVFERAVVERCFGHSRLLPVAGDGACGWEAVQGDGRYRSAD